MTVVMEAPQRLMTVDEFMELPGVERAELINGKVVEKMPPGEEHGFLALALGSVLRAWALEHKAGRVYVEATFRLKRDPDVARAPDVSFLATQHLPAQRALPGYIDGPPTLAIEIVSPHDLWSDVEDKVNEYLEAGARAVWIVQPANQTVTIRTADAAPGVLHRSQTLAGGDLLPGFELPLSELFEDAL